MIPKTIGWVWEGDNQFFDYKKLPKQRNVSDGGRLSTFWLKWMPNVRLVINGGRWSTGWSKNIPKLSEVRVGGRLFTDWLNWSLNLRKARDGERIRNGRLNIDTGKLEPTGNSIWIKEGGRELSGWLNDVPK